MRVRRGPLLRSEVGYTALHRPELRGKVPRAAAGVRGAGRQVAGTPLHHTLSPRYQLLPSLSIFSSTDDIFRSDLSKQFKQENQ